VSKRQGRRAIGWIESDYLYTAQTTRKKRFARSPCSFEKIFVSTRIRMSSSSVSHEVDDVRVIQPGQVIGTGRYEWLLGVEQHVHNVLRGAKRRFCTECLTDTLLQCDTLRIVTISFTVYGL
jgi:hypothetical protein